MDRHSHLILPGFELAFKREAVDPRKDRRYHERPNDERLLNLVVHLRDDVSHANEMAQAALSLNVTPREVEEFVIGRGRPAGPPWTQELRRAYAAGIAALAQHASARLSLPATT
jgi:hypothetical protein